VYRNWIFEQLKKQIKSWKSFFGTTSKDHLISAYLRTESSRADCRISQVFYRTTPPQGDKEPDIKEPGLRPGRSAGAEFAGRAACTPKKNIRAESV
jgi:hypothetical protein